MSKEIPILFSTPMVQAILGGTKTMTRRIVKHPPVIDEQSGDAYLPAFNEVVPLEDYLKTMVEQHKIKVGDLLWVRENFRVNCWFPDDGEICFSFATDDDYVTPAMCFDDDYCGEIFNRYWIQSCEDLDKAGIEINKKTECYEDYDVKKLRLRPSIHLPKAASRIWLEVVSVKVERLQDISEEDVIAEGVPEHNYNDPVYPPDYKLCPACGGTFLHGALGDSLGYMEVDCSTCDTAKKRFKILWNNINGNWDSNPWVWVIEFKVLSTTGKT